jgi:hypothetical protein
VHDGAATNIGQLYAKHQDEHARPGGSQSITTLAACTFVQLSRRQSLDGIMLVSKEREKDFVSNKVHQSMIAAEMRLELLNNVTVEETES